MRTTIFISALLAACVLAASAQTPAFEVVSIKPSPPDNKYSQTTYDPGRIIAHGVNLKQLIEWAYQVTSVQVSGGPGWMDSQYFDLEAKAEGEHTKDELLRMLEPVLADRFKLALHHDKKEMSIYTLTAPGNRSQLHQAQGGPANIALQFAKTGAGNGVALMLNGQSVSMPYMANYLTGPLDQIVVDRTSLPGSFDFKVEIPLDEAEITDKRTTVTNAVLTAMPKLGLKLETHKEPVDLLVVDHAEPPSGN